MRWTFSKTLPIRKQASPKPPGWASGTRCTSAAAFVQKRDQALLNPEKRWVCIYDFSSELTAIPIIQNASFCKQCFRAMQSGKRRLNHERTQTSRTKKTADGVAAMRLLAAGLLFSPGGSAAASAGAFGHRFRAGNGGGASLSPAADGGRAGRAGAFRHRRHAGRWLGNQGHRQFAGASAPASGHGGDSGRSAPVPGRAGRGRGLADGGCTGGGHQRPDRRFQPGAAGRAESRGRDHPGQRQAPAQHRGTDGAGQRGRQPGHAPHRPPEQRRASPDAGTPAGRSYRQLSYRCMGAGFHCRGRHAFLLRTGRGKRPAALRRVGARHHRRGYPADFDPFPGRIDGSG